MKYLLLGRTKTSQNSAMISFGKAMLAEAVCGIPTQERPDKQNSCYVWSVVDTRTNSHFIFFAEALKSEGFKVSEHRMKDVNYQSQDSSVTFWSRGVKICSSVFNILSQEQASLAFLHPSSQSGQNKQPSLQTCEQIAQQN